MRTIPENSDAALRARGLRLTGPRRVVLEVLRGTDAHPTAESVHRLVRRRLPRVSLGTVYRNLRLLVAEGLAAEIPGPHARFDANMDAHHHFTCVRCGRIVDVDGPLAAPLTLSPTGTDPKEERPWQARASRGPRATRTSRKPSPASPRRTAAISISPAWRTSRASRTSPGCSRTRRMPRPATPSATWTS